MAVSKGVASGSSSVKFPWSLLRSEAEVGRRVGLGIVMMTVVVGRLVRVLFKFATVEELAVRANVGTEVIFGPKLDWSVIGQLEAQLVVLSSGAGGGSDTVPSMPPISKTKL